MAATHSLGPQLERRAHRRISVRLPVVVRAADPTGAALEESTHSLNISRMGAAFAARLPLEVGRLVEVTIPAPGPRRESAKDFFTRARVVRVDIPPPTAFSATTTETFEAAFSAGPSPPDAPNPPRIGGPPSAQFPASAPNAFAPPSNRPAPDAPTATSPSAVTSSPPSTSIRLIAVEFLGQQYPHVFVSESTS